MADFGVKCNFCQLTGLDFKKCSRCKNVYYCSKACQTKEWSVHRRVCKEKTQSTKRKRDEGEKEVAIKLSKHNSGSDAHHAGQRTVQCTHCGLLGNHKKCSRCKHAFYCSHDCQDDDWVLHKNMCKKKRSDFDERLMKSYKEKNLSSTFEMEDLEGSNNFNDNRDHREQKLTPEQAKFRASRPEGSLQAAVIEAKRLFPLFLIMTSFDDVPLEDNIDLSYLLRSTGHLRCLLSFMYRYHENATRHGVYLKDDKDNLSKVEFYIDDSCSDNPMPFFSYQQVKPGGYIGIINPVMHVFEDGTLGFRVDDPLKVLLLDT